MRIKRLIRLLRMNGSVGQRIGTGVVIIVGFIVGIHLGRLLLEIM